MARMKYTKEFKAEAVALVLERGLLSASQVARDLGVGQPTYAPRPALRATRPAKSSRPRCDCP